MRLAVVTLLMMLTLAPAAQAAWTSAGGGAAHTFAHPGLTASFREAWSKRLAPWDGQGGGLIEHGVTVAGGRVFGTTIDGTTVALDAWTGRTLWARDLGGRFATAPTYSNGRLFVQSFTNPTLKALDARTGRVLWKRRLVRGPVGFAQKFGRSEGAPTVVRGRVYVSTFRRLRGTWKPDTGKVLAFTTRGRRLFSRRTCGGWQSPVWTGRYLVSADTCGTVRALTRWGRLAWQRRIGTPTYAQLGYLRGRVIIPARSGRVYALKATTGRRLWMRRVGYGTGYPDCALTRHRVFCANHDGRVAALRMRTGRKVWARRFNRPIFGAVGYSRGFVWVALHPSGRRRGSVVGLRPRNGAVRRRMAGGCYDPFAADGRTIYIIHCTRVRALRSP